MCPVVKAAVDHVPLRSLSLIIAGLAIIMLLPGCMSMRWGLQAVGGQMEILSARTDIDKLLADPATDAELRQQLQQVIAIRDFASHELGLPDNDSYTSYADLQRDQVLWNVVAAKPDQLQAKTWCYLLVGCLAYRGWFAEHNAWREARYLQRQQLDVSVSAVTDYSTLGWFDDPLLNTMRDYPEPVLAELLFHELAHQQLYIKHDTAFNEAYATAVAQIGVQRWLQARAQFAADQDFRQQRLINAQINAWITQTREQLQRTFQAPGSVEQKLQAKQAHISGLRQTWLSAMLASAPGEFPHTGLRRWQRWFTQPLNNAHFVLHATYEQGVGSFLHLYACLQQDIQAFYAASKAMQDWSAAARTAWLQQPAAASAQGQELADYCSATVQQQQQGLQ
jgi:predicted aminopeptidase